MYFGTFESIGEIQQWSLKIWLVKLSSHLEIHRAIWSWGPCDGIYVDSLW